MRFFTLIAGTALAALAFAQESSVAFTSVPASVVIGHSYNITWGGGSSAESVTITLRKGDVDDIQTVQILTTSATGSSFTWTPSSSLINGDDYTLQITQGLNDINFSGDFTISGGIDPISASISSILASASAALSSANATITSLAAITSSYATSSGLGSVTPLPRNTTFSSATLGASATSATDSGSVASSTSGTVTGSATSSSASPSTSSTAAGEALSSEYASPMALVCALLAAIAFAV